MGVSIWEGEKAQALIDAISQANKIDKQQGTANAGKALVVGADGIVGFGDVGLSESAKAALIECFRNVAWINENGATLYSNLYRSLYGGVPSGDTSDEWTWVYDSSTNISFNDFEYVDEITTETGSISTSLGEGGMRFYAEQSSSGNAAVYNLTPNTSNNASLEIEIKIMSVPLTQTGGGFMAMIGDGTYSSVIYVHHKPSDRKLYLGTQEFYDGELHYVDLEEIQFDTTYVLRVELSNGTSILKVDGREIFNSSRLNKSTYYHDNCIRISTPADSSAGSMWCAVKSIKFKDLS